MSNIWFTADTHFGHNNIVRYCDRPFKSYEDMDERLIANWNAAVRPEDTIYHLGDWSLRNCEKYFLRLNGKKHIIFGNHDKEARRNAHLFESASDYKEIKVGDQHIVLIHYALRVWNKSHYGSWALYGHSHGTLPDDPHALSLDVGVDCHNYAPVSFEGVKKLMSKKFWRPVDHHSREKGGGIGLDKVEYAKKQRRATYLSLKKEFDSGRE